jgi:hypothetical protein
MMRAACRPVPPIASVEIAMKNADPEVIDTYAVVAKEADDFRYAARSRISGASRAAKRLRTGAGSLRRSRGQRPADPDEARSDETHEEVSCPARCIDACSAARL